jgi:hypothetical protein
VADATRIVRTCEGCQFYARQTHLPAQALQTIPITWPFAVWGLDLVGPLQKAPGGYTHLLVAIDKFSKWIEVRPLNSIRSEQAMAFLANVPVHTQSLVDKEGSALPQQSPTLPRGLKGGNPLCVKIFNQKGFRAPPAMSVAGPQEANMGACKWQGRPSRETPTPLGYGYLTRHLPRKMTPTWASHPATGERGQTRKMEEKEPRLYTTIIKVFGPQRPQKTQAHSKGTAPAELGVAWGRSRAFGLVHAFGKAHPSFGRRCRREDLCLEGGRQHCARARGGCVEPLDFSQGGFVFIREAIPLADPLQINDVVGSKHSEGPPDAVVQRLAESAAHMVTQGLQATLKGAP